MWPSTRSRGAMWAAAASEAFNEYVMLQAALHESCPHSICHAVNSGRTRPPEDVLACKHVLDVLTCFVDAQM